MYAKKFSFHHVKVKVLAISNAFEQFSESALGTVATLFV